MAFDRGLEARLYEHFNNRHDLVVKRMFGGLCFLLSEHMCCAIIGDKLMARIGPDHYERCLAKPYVTDMDFTGKPIRSMVYVLSEGFESDEDLIYWLNLCTAFVDSLPPKKPKRRHKKECQD
ncbi:TfoX family protein [Amphritea opalescens]|uniref:TfoX family protein n=1 Tax=Amphritea opalescens TaxID=2490544 RepID=A0A430KVF4_9GAMM|nr:TfoX/Sxy family protein [Amphritea opalescens]RTE67446.1 TfoX family protein [Amphritea opalescens]